MAERSGNPNPEIHINPNIAEAGKATQFGQPNGPDPVAARNSPERTAHYHVRSQLRYLAMQPLSADMNKIDEELARLRPNEEGTTTAARLIALRQIEKAIKKGDTAAATFVTENIEGKLSQEIVLPPSTKAPTEFGSLEEASQAYKKFAGT